MDFTCDKKYILEVGDCLSSRYRKDKITPPPPKIHEIFGKNKTPRRKFKLAREARQNFLRVLAAYGQKLEGGLKDVAAQKLGYWIQCHISVGKTMTARGFHQINSSISQLFHHKKL